MVTLQYMRFLYILIGFLTLSSCNQRDSKEGASASTIMDGQDTVAIALLADTLLFENDTLAIYGIDSLTYVQKRLKATISKDTLKYISDFADAKALLKGRVTFGDYNPQTRKIDSLLKGEMPVKILADNGKIIESNEERYFWDMHFVAYYPSEEVLLCEGGHSSDFSIDLKRGIVGAEIVGNPQYIQYSTTKKYRLNGWFPGQECATYFIQQRSEEGYDFYANVPMHSDTENFVWCNIAGAFWTSDEELCFKNVLYEKPNNRFFKLVLKN